jgi:hypothetical protein
LREVRHRETTMLMVDVGANHDSLVLNESEFYTHEPLFFQDSTGYILGDSAYRLTNRCMKSYTKKECTDDEEGRYIQFNIQYSSARVKVEHTFANMKMRFPLMAGLSTVLGSQEGNQRGVKFIFATCILHNFLLTAKDEWIPTEEDLALINEGAIKAYDSVLQSQWLEAISNEERTVTERKVGELKRKWLTGILIDWLLAEGKIAHVDN